MRALSLALALELACGLLVVEPCSQACLTLDSGRFTIVHIEGFGKRIRAQFNFIIYKSRLEVQ